AGVEHQAVAVEAFDVVALVRRAVAPDVDLVLAHGPHEVGPGDGSADRRGVEVRLAGRDDVERPALQGGEAFAGDRLPAVDDPGQLCAVGLGPFGDGVEVTLVVLADIGRVGVRDGALLAEPGDGDGGVEPAREGDADALADGDGRQNGHGR